MLYISDCFQSSQFLQTNNVQERDIGRSLTFVSFYNGMLYVELLRYRLDYKYYSYISIFRPCFTRNTLMLYTMYYNLQFPCKPSGNIATSMYTISTYKLQIKLRTLICVKLGLSVQTGFACGFQEKGHCQQLAVGPFSGKFPF